MAAPTFAAAGTGVAFVGSGTSSITVSATNGDVIVFHWSSGHSSLAAGDIVLDAAGTSNLADLAGTNDAMTLIAGTDLGTSVYKTGTTPVGGIAFGRATATATITLSITLSAAVDPMYARLYAFTGVNTGSTLADIIENATAGSVVAGSGTTAAISDVGVQTLGADRIACNFVGVNDDNALAVFTGQTGGTWVEPVAEFTSTAGNPDGALQIQTADMAAAGTIDGGSQTMSAADNWHIAGFAFKPDDTGADNQLAWTVA